MAVKNKAKTLPINMLNYFESDMKLSISFISLLILTGCASYKSASVEQIGKQSKICIDYKWSMPAEHVDAATYGKKSGGGHFEVPDGSFMTHDYENFGSASEAKSALDKAVAETGRVLRSAKLKDKDGEEIGQKAVVNGSGERPFNLYWTNSTTLYAITGETDAAINYAESLCNF